MLDLAIAFEGSHEVGVVGAVGASFSVFTGDGLFGFDPPRAFGTHYGPIQALVVDLDHDARPDVLAHTGLEGSIDVLLHR